LETQSIRRFIAALALGLAAGFAQAGDITVSAASSLTNVFSDIARSYEAAHPGSKVALNFGASGTLLQQVARGAPVDVLATADQQTMDLAQAQRLVVDGDRRDFARNMLVLVVPMDSKQPLDRLEDLALPAVQRIAIGNPASVPVGRYARRALDAAGLWAAVSAKAILTENVRQSLDYVARGEVDAGFVYATDAMIMKGEVGVAFAVPQAGDILYPIARTADSANADEAARFIAFVVSPAGQAILHRYGFQAP